MVFDHLKYHQWCISDPVAMSAYRKAIQQTVRPGDVVLDLGAGTGILAYQACSAGAAKVYAVEPSEIAALVPKIADDNGLAGRIIIRKGLSYDTELPEKADVMIASMLGSAGIGNDMLPAVLDARQRLMKPGARIIPLAIQPSFCPVELAEWYEQRINCWNLPQEGFDFSAARAIAVNRAGYGKITKEALLAEPQCFDEIRLADITSPSVRANFNFRINRAGIFHCLAGWVHMTMIDGMGCSTSPMDARPMPWDHMMLPAGSPVSVDEGDTIRTSIRADSVRGSSTMTWDVRVSDASGALKAKFRHSTFFGLLLAREELAKHS